MATPGVQLVIDGVEVEVAPGTGLVEAAASAGIEVPVFCYEPRIGPAVGACRMCLVEIEGMPKLQTACSTEARPGMVVSTVGKKARDAQEAVLEFLLINHPLDCPVCDKGGECPLQDHAYRCGPGASRFLEIKRNADKPIPVSPLIALDRERCILCYRCTRFSEEVSQDLQLVPRERGASTVITTFEGRPYADRFSGNVIELCPVGALTSTEYRFHGRPWDAPDHPTVCSGCAVGCNTLDTVRDGSVIRVLSRENTEIDGGWLCDRGRFAYTSGYSDSRITTPVKRDWPMAPPENRPVSTISTEQALEELSRRLTAARESGSGAPTWVLSGAETLEEAWLAQQLAGASGGRVVAIDGASSPLPDVANRATLADVEQAEHIVVLGDPEASELAPIVELRIKKAMLRGQARALVAGIGGSRIEQAGAAHAFVRPGRLNEFVPELLADGDATRGMAAGRTVVIAADGELSADSLAALVDQLGLSDAGSGLLLLPWAANSRGLAALGIESVDLADLDSGAPLIFFNVDPDRHWRRQAWQAVLHRAPWVVSWAGFHSAHLMQSDLVIPAATAHEAEGSLVNLEGRIQHRPATAVAPDGVETAWWWLTQLGRRLDLDLPGSVMGAFRACAADRGELLPAQAIGDVPAGGALGVVSAPGVAAASVLPIELDGAGDSAADGGTSLTVFVAPFLYDAADVRHANKMAFLTGDAASVAVSREDARTAGLAAGDSVEMALWDGAEWVVVPARLAVSARIETGHARMFAGQGEVPSRLRGYRIGMLRAATQADSAAALSATDTTSADGPQR